MALFVTISRGRSADQSKPVLVTADVEVVRRVLEEISRLQSDEPMKSQPAIHLAVAGPVDDCGKEEK